MESADIVTKVCNIAADAVNGFESFMKACGKHSQSEATSHLLSVSASMQQILDFVSKEDEDTVMKVADSVSAFSQSFVLMLWGSAST